jgi:DNA-binding LacI/PurR family transcriptional regulator
MSSRTRRPAPADPALDATGDPPPADTAGPGRAPDGRPAGRVTLREVAAAAGVAMSTVSRSLSGDAQISDATRERVTAVAEAMGYVPDAAARSLAVRSSRTLALLLPDATDPVHGVVIAAVERAAEAEGYTVIVANSGGEAQRERQAIREFTAHRADGIVVMGSVLDPEAVAALLRPSPVVFLNSERLGRDGDPTMLPAGCFRPDERDGMRQVAEHLVAGGRRRIAFVQAERPATGPLRVRALREALAALPSGGGARGGTAVVAEIAYDPDARVDVARHVAASGADAVVCYDDRVAIGLLDAFRTLEVRVPDEMAVVGFDDIPFAELANPRLTTVNQPAAEMGAIAIAALTDAIATGSLARSRTLPVRLVVRESTLPRS